MEPMSSKPRSFFTPKKLYMMQQKQQEGQPAESGSGSSAGVSVSGGRADKKLPEDPPPGGEGAMWEEREPELLHSPMKRSRGKTGKHLRLLAALDKEKPKPEQQEDEPMAKSERGSERGSEQGYTVLREGGKRLGEEPCGQPELQVKKPCEKKVSPGKDMRALMEPGRGRGRGRGRPPKSSYEARSRYPSTRGPEEPVFKPWDGGPLQDKGPTQIPQTHRRPSVDTSHDGPLRGGDVRGGAAPESARVRHHSDMCNEITSSGDPVKAASYPAGPPAGPPAGQWEPLETELVDRMSCLVKVEPDSQRVGGSMMPDSQRARAGTGAGDQHSCMVCGDVAAGFHCGAYVCEACKKFFVRCLKQDVGNKFMCSKNKSCVVNRETRTQCQFCRYQKCISLGMYKPGSGPGGGKFGAEISHIPCKVCESPSSGYHFGAITCEGCKGFFRRTVKERSGVRYVCSRSGACNITVNTRNVCKSCRYQKCLQAGMTPDGSRIGRQPNAVKHATMLELQRLGCGSTPGDSGGMVEVKQEVVSPPSEQQDLGFPDNAQFEMIDPSNLPEELYLTQSEEEGKLRAIKNQPLSPSDILDAASLQSEPNDLKLYKPAYSQYSGRQPQYGGHFGEVGKGSRSIQPSSGSFHDSRPIAMKTGDLRHQPMMGYSSKGDELFQRELAHREQSERDQVQLEQVQREQAQREQAQRELAQREQVQRELAQRELEQRAQLERQQAQRDQAQRDQVQREQAQREQAQREQAQRDQMMARGQRLEGSPLRLPVSPQSADMSAAEYGERLARIEALNAQQQELKWQEQQKALELKLEISKLASHSQYMLDIRAASDIQVVSDKPGFVQGAARGPAQGGTDRQQLVHGKRGLSPSALVGGVELGQQRREVPSRATSMDSRTPSMDASYTSPDSASFSMSPDNKPSPLHEDWCGAALVCEDRGMSHSGSKVIQGHSPVPQGQRPAPRSVSPPRAPTDNSPPQQPTDLSTGTRSFSRSVSEGSVTKKPTTDCFEIISRVPANQKVLLETITRASLLLRPILSKSEDCAPVDMNSSVEEMWNTMMGQFNQCAKSVINFARKVPGFLQFPIPTQIMKVQMAMYPIVLTVLSTQYNMETREYNYFHMTPDERQLVYKLFPGFVTLQEHFHSMGHSVKFVEMDDIEIAFMCAIVLMTSDPASDGLSKSTDTESDLIEALHIYCKEKEGADTNRDGYILARLAEVNRCNAEHQKAVLHVMMSHPSLKVPQLYEETYLAI